MVKVMTVVRDRIVVDLCISIFSGSVRYKVAWADQLPLPGSAVYSLDQAQSSRSLKMRNEC